MRLAVVDLDELPGVFREAMRIALASETVTLAVRHAGYNEPECSPLVGAEFERVLVLMSKACAKRAGNEVDVAVLIAALDTAIDSHDRRARGCDSAAKYALEPPRGMVVRARELNDEASDHREKRDGIRRLLLTINHKKES